MKNTPTFRNLHRHTLFYLSSLFVLFFAFFITSCSDTEDNLISENSEYIIQPRVIPGVTNVNGILHFDKRIIIEEIYEELLLNQNTGLDSTLHDTICIGGINPYLDEFEEDLLFYSSRRTFEAINCQEQNNGVPALQQTESHIFDDVMATLISPDYKVVIDDTLFYWAGTNLIYYAIGENAEEKLDDIAIEGKTSTEVGAINHLNNKFKSGGCNPNFSMTVDHANNSITVNYTGGGNPNRITWTVNPTQTVSANSTQFDINNIAPGQKVEVCCTVKDDNGTPDDKTDDCEENRCKEITMGDCVADFDFTESAGGMICFIDKSSTAGGGSITSREWKIQGQTINTNNPCSQFPCNGVFEVTLIIHSAFCPGGQKEITREIEVTSVECCGKKGKDSGTQPYNGSSNQWVWKWHLGSDVIWDQRLSTKLISEVRKGNSSNWRKQAIAKMYIDFEGDLYKKDQDDCTCKLIENIAPDPAGMQPYSKKIVVVDKLGGIKFQSRKKKWKRIKGDDPIIIKYGCSIWPIIDVNTFTNGMECDD